MNNRNRLGPPGCAMSLILVLSAPAWAGELPASKAFTNSIGMKFVRIEPGEFEMGTGDRPPRSEQEWTQRDWDESPAHKVRITGAFGTRMSCVAFNEAWLKEGKPIRQQR